MSFLGVGVFIGTVISAVSFVPKVTREPGSIQKLVTFVGFLAMFVLPSIGDSALLNLLCPIVAIVVVPLIIWNGRIEELEAESDREKEANQHAADEANARREAKEAAIASAKANWINQQSGWHRVTMGKVLNLPGAPKCMFMEGGDGKLIKIALYQDKNSFFVSRQLTFACNQIISLDIASPTLNKTRTNQVPVAMVQKEQRSPITRGLIGGVLLGPAGVVLGAASGLGGKVSTEVKHHAVTEHYTELGDQQLIMGTSVDEAPILKIKFDPPDQAEQWMYRIRSMQARVPGR